jgi:putative hydrolase of the HAD superfamily
MAIRTVLFDIGGVLEITPATGWEKRWEAMLGLPPGALDQRMAHVWRAGSLGTISEAEAQRQIGALLKLDRAQLGAFMADLWEEYLGQLNAEITSYFAGLRPRYQTALLSNSFVGAREKEQARYRFGQMCDLIIYSHEEGMQKPDRRFFELACQRLGASPAEIVFVDDHAPNVAAARALGMHGVLFQNTAQAIADIQAQLGEI